MLDLNWLCFAICHCAKWPGFMWNAWIELEKGPESEWATVVLSFFYVWWFSVCPFFNSSNDEADDYGQRRWWLYCRWRCVHISVIWRVCALRIWACKPPNFCSLSVSPMFDDSLSFSPTYAHDSIHEHIQIATDGSARLKVFCTREFGSWIWDLAFSTFSEHN